MKRTWWTKHKKWILSSSFFVLFLYIIMSSELTLTARDLTTAYLDESLFDDALKITKTNKSVIEHLGNIEPLDKMAILEGQVEYSKNKDTVISSVRLNSERGKAKMDFKAIQFDGTWEYETISVRIKHPENEQTVIRVLPR